MCCEEGEKGRAAGCCIGEGGPGLAHGGFLKRQWVRDRRDELLAKRERGKLFACLRLSPGGRQQEENATMKDLIPIVFPYEVSSHEKSELLLRDQ